jgi:hypothetical protein
MRHATPAEYSELLSELHAIGYENLKIVKRISQEMDSARRANERAA